jgi:Secretion system C-terminal sorting domain
MKTTLFLTALLAAGVNLSAQYYQRAYGGPGPGCDVLRDGTPTMNGGDGHLLVGHTDAFAGQDLTFTRTDDNGGFSMPVNFNNGNRFFNGSIQLGIDPVEVLHTPSSRIVVVCNTTRFAPGNMNEILVGVSTPNGNFFSQIGFNEPTFQNAFATSACISTFNQAEMFITGYVNSPNSSNVQTFIICYNWQGNATVWSQVYDLIPSAPDNNTPEEIICSPYANEMAIIGTYWAGLNTQNGFYFRVDPQTGNIIQSTLFSGVSGDVIYYNNGGIDVFNSITTGSSTSGGSQGYVIAGNSDFDFTQSQAQPWILKIDIDGNVLWSNYVRFGNGDARHTNIIERLNTSGNYEYYTTGSASQGYLSGDQDILVFKFDDAGNALQEFNYNNPGFQYGVSAGLVENTAFDGLGIYGTDGSGFLSGIPGDLYMVKAYFDGSNACNESINPGTSVAWRTAHWPDAISITGSMIDFPINEVALGPIADFPYCSTPSIAGASNARSASQTEPTFEEIKLSVSPNPVTAKTQSIQLTSNYADETQLLISIVSIEGREVERFSQTVAGGQQQTLLALNTGIAAGVYLLKITGNGKTETIRLVIQ